MVKKLLCCFSKFDANTSRAINAIGNNNSLTLFKKRTNKRLYRDIKEIYYDNSYIEFKLFIESYYSEVFFSIGYEELSDDIFEILNFYNSLNIKNKKFIIGDKFPQKTYEEALIYSPFDWVKTLNYNNLRNKINDVKLYAIVGVYNEDDIIYATVKHAFMQGCEKVFIIDNNSKDNTILEAKKAGAEIYKVFETKEYDELFRIRLMNDAIEDISLKSKEDEIWWLWLDADEFPQGPQDKTIKKFLSEIPSECRVVGAQQINHFPKDKPYYVSRKHPFEFMPYAQEYKTDRLPINHCDLKHWKHPLHKYVKGKPSIRAKSGFHMAYSDEILYEPNQHIELHHFPYRDEAKTKQRYGMLTSGRNTGNDTRSPNGKSAITKRQEAINYVYEQEWSKVYIDPVAQTDISQIGINPLKLNFNQPLWYEKDENEGM